MSDARGSALYPLSRGGITEPFGCDLDQGGQRKKPRRVNLAIELANQRFRQDGIGNQPNAGWCRADESRFAPRLGAEVLVLPHH